MTSQAQGCGPENQSDPDSMAGRADRYALYQESVQDVESEIDFVLATWSELRSRPAALLREDFCGAANTACEWVKRSHSHQAYGVDHDPDVLAWGARHNVSRLTSEQQTRVELIRADVNSNHVPAADIVLAMNFSYYLLNSRHELRRYFKNVRSGLKADGILFLDAFGGYEAHQELEESRPCQGFTYIWEQASFNPIDAMMQCHIHFEFPDESRWSRAFSYHWRLWSLPETQELLREAGFEHVDVYWEGTDPESGEGDGIYRPATTGDADPGWVCYVVAQNGVKAG